MGNYNFGPNVIYFALGITESRPAGVRWADKIVFWAGKASRRGLLGGQKFADPSLRFRPSLGEGLPSPPPPPSALGPFILGFRHADPGGYLNQAGAFRCNFPWTITFQAQNTIWSAQKAPAGRFSGSKYNLIRPNGPCGTLFVLKIQFDPPKRSTFCYS